MSERENLATGVYMGLTAFLVLICLIGAFVLPPSVVDSKWLGVFGLVGLFVITPVLFRLADRSRIRDAVAKLGGSALLIKKLPFWDQPFCRYYFFLGLRYRVEYMDLMGELHRALCTAGFFQGVVWLEDIVIAPG